MGLKKLIFFLNLFFLAISSQAVLAAGKDQPWTFTFYFENDLFSDTDQNYTNGTKLSWVSPDLTGYAEDGRLPDWSLKYIRWLPFINEPGLQRNIALSIGQNMYTPEDISKEELVEDDRPYAGWTYFGIAFHSKNERRLDSMEIQLGIVGPESFAEETQKLVHELVNSKQPKGWDNQLNNEPGLAMVYECRLRFLRERAENGMGYDAITHLGATVGNVYTYANTGLEIRGGWNIPKDFGTALIRPAGDSSATVSAMGSRPSIKKKFSIHVFAGVSGRLVLRDIFLDGNTFTDSHSINKEYFVADAYAGISLTVYRFKLSYTQVARSKEFEGQDDNHCFGSIALSYSY